MPAPTHTHRGYGGLVSVMERNLLRVVGTLGLVLAYQPAVFAGTDAVERITLDVAGLARQPMIPMPYPPRWVVVPTARTTIEEVIAEIKKSSGKPPTVNYSAQAFVRPDLEWLLAFVKWFGKLCSSLDIHYEDQLFDCDKYARCFVAFADLLARKGGETRGTICVGWVTVFNDESFAGMAPGGAHAVVIVETMKGFYVIEPQNGTIVPLGEYPNRDSMVAVYL